MLFQAKVSSTIAVCCIAVAAQAQQFSGMQNDPGVMQALDQMGYAFGSACQLGDQNGCMGYNYIQQIGSYMMGASGACLQGDQSACFAYSQSYQQLDADYGMFLQQYAGQQQGYYDPNYSAAQHQQRMQDIYNFGAQNTANWNAQQQQNDLQHQQFIESIRQ